MSYNIIETKAYAQAIKNDIQLAFTDDQKLHSLNIQALIDWTKRAKEVTTSEFSKKRFGVIQKFVDCNWGVINTLNSLEKNLQDLIVRKEKLAEEEIAVRKIQDLRKFRLFEDEGLEVLEAEFKKMKTLMTNLNIEKTFTFIPAPVGKTTATLCVYSKESDQIEQYPVDLMKSLESYVFNHSKEYKNLQTFLDSFQKEMISFGILKDFVEFSPHSNSLSTRLSKDTVEKKMSQLNPRIPMWLIYPCDDGNIILSKMNRFGKISHATIKSSSWNGTYTITFCEDSKEISLTRQALRRYLRTFGKPIVLNEKPPESTSTT